MLKKASWSLRRCIKLWDIWLTDNHAISTATEKEMSFSAIIPNVSLLDVFLFVWWGGYFLNLIMHWHRNVLQIYLVKAAICFSSQTLNQGHHSRCLCDKTIIVQHPWHAAAAFALFFFLQMILRLLPLVFALSKLSSRLYATDFKNVVWNKVHWRDFEAVEV